MVRPTALRLRVILALVFVGAAFFHAGHSSQTSDTFSISLPHGIPKEIWSYYIPKDNPPTAAKVELGRQLFFDKRLSADESISCASCHDPALAFADGKRVAEGISGRRGERNSPTLLNAMFNSGQFWDGRADTLEEQAIQPLINPDEMGNESFEAVVRRLQAVPEYATRFREVFGRAVSIELMGKAIASFERTLISGDSPFDRFMSGDRAAMTDAAQRGFLLFRTKGRCTQCHTFNAAFPFFTDQNYRNTGVAANSKAFEPLSREALQMPQSGDLRARLEGFARRGGARELGRFLVTGNSLDIGAFRTPSLRDVELTAPYFHDGSAATLKDVLKFYARGGNDNPMRDWELQTLDLDDREQQDIIEFLKSLTSNHARQNNRESNE
ncbi:MAG TPA: cytochrome c peroxidase [Blastocatellia bacterium]|nr:cytochrome c peroxidase [Blastocatellia bacterium]